MKKKVKLFLEKSGKDKQDLLRLGKSTGEFLLFHVEFCNVLLGAQDVGELHSDDSLRNLPKHDRTMSYDPKSHICGYGILIVTNCVSKKFSFLPLCFSLQNFN